MKLLPHLLSRVAQSSILHGSPETANCEQRTENGAAPQSRRSAFTLIELLVVIAIIGVLVGLLAGGIKASAESAKKRERSTELKSLESAIMTYWHDTGKPPITPTSGKYTYTFKEDNHDIFEILVNPDNKKNPQKKRYLDMNQLRTADSSGQIRRMEKVTESIADPYGKFYKVTINLKNKTATVE